MASDFVEFILFNKRLGQTIVIKKIESTKFDKINVKIKRKKIMVKILKTWIDNMIDYFIVGRGIEK